jgi:probable rRNA maturation factor
MAAKYSIPMRIEPAYRRLVDGRRLAKMAEDVLAAEGVSAAELSIYVTDDATVQSLNREFLGLDEPTDVLSFPFGKGDFITSDRDRLLGEVIISYPTAEKQAREEGHLVGSEIAHLLVHGVLHILGYDHLEAEDERRMRQREAELLGGDPH